MKKKTLNRLCKWSWVALLVLVMSAANTFAQVPMAINYQGYLSDSEGYPIQGTETITFRIYDAPIAGTLHWAETHSVVDVEAGVFSVILGQFTPLDADVAINGTRYLGITVGSDSEMVPRQRLTSVPYALRAAVAESIEAGQFLGDLSVSGQVLVGTEDKNLTLFAWGSLVDLASTGSDLAINYMGLNNTVMNVEEGNVGIGTAAPGEKLSVAGTIESSSGGFKFPDGNTQTSAGYTQAEVNAMVADLQSQIDQLKTLLAGVTRSGTDLTFSGVNVKIVNGMGSTETSNGTGNLIVGYNEPRWPFWPPEDDVNIRTGSHNVIIGRRHDFSSYGGIVVGNNNAILHHYASVTGGSDNIASGQSSSVSGGQNNLAIGNYSTVNGGGGANLDEGNKAFGHYTAILGGGRNIAGDRNLTNHAIGQQATVSGGRWNIASGNYSAIAGGGGTNLDEGNKAFGHYTAILGGGRNIAGDRNLTNHAIGQQATVSGGRWNIASGNYSAIAGGGGLTEVLKNIAFGHYTSILGGVSNIAGDPSLNDHTIGQQATVSGGGFNRARGLYSSVGGGRWNVAQGGYASVAGGGGATEDLGNKALAQFASILGGASNVATEGLGSSVSGGRNNVASGDYASVTGGGGENLDDGNQAFGHYTAILGGVSNIAGDNLLVNHARGQNSTVSGGKMNRATGHRSSVSGGLVNYSNGEQAWVGGGNNNEARNDYSSVSGGASNRAIGDGASISGGRDNGASGQYSTVTGGRYNSASGDDSSVSGGYSGGVSEQYNWRAGGLFQNQ